MSEQENERLFHGYCAWFSNSVPKAVKEKWVQYGGGVCEDFEKALFIFSDNQSSTDIKRVFEKITDTNLVVFKSSWIDEAISFSKSSMLSTKGIEKFILLPEDLEEELKMYSDSEKCKKYWANQQNQDNWDSFKSELAHRTCSTTVSTPSKNITINLSKVIHESSEIDECTDHLSPIKPEQSQHDSCINHGNDRQLKNNKNTNDSVNQSENGFVDFSLSKALSPQQLKCTSSVNNIKKSPVNVCLNDDLTTFKCKIDDSSNRHKSKYSLRNSKSYNDNILPQDSMKSEAFKKDIIPDNEKTESLLQARSKVFTPECQITPLKLNQQGADSQNISPSYNLVNVEKNSDEKFKSNKKTNCLRKYDFTPKILPGSPGPPGPSAIKLNICSQSTSASLPSDGVMQPKRPRKNNFKCNEVSTEGINDDIDLEEEYYGKETESVPNKRRKKKLYTCNHIGEILTPVTVNLTSLDHISPKEINNILYKGKEFNVELSSRPPSSQFKDQNTNRNSLHEKTTDVMKEHIKTLKHKRLGVKNVDNFAFGSYAGFNHIDDLDLPHLILEDFVVNKFGCRVVLRDFNV